MSPKQETLSVTPASEWKKRREGFLLKLPSGRVIKVRPTFSLWDLIRKNMIPNPLATLVTAGKPFYRSELSSEMLLMMDEATDLLVSISIVEPKVLMVPEGEDPDTWEPEDPDACSIRDFSGTDKNFIYAVVQGGTTDVDAFLAEQAARVATVADEPKMDDTSIEVAEFRDDNP